MVLVADNMILKQIYPVLTDSVCVGMGGGGGGEGGSDFWHVLVAKSQLFFCLPQSLC